MFILYYKRYNVLFYYIISFFEVQCMNKAQPLNRNGPLAFLLTTTASFLKMNEVVSAMSIKDILSYSTVSSQKFKKAKLNLRSESVLNESRNKIDQFCYKNFGNATT